MSPVTWYELRVAGSSGTQAGIAKSTAEGIAIAENGRLCPIASGHAKRFESEQAATRYLLTMTIPGHYRFEAVRCHSVAAAALQSADQTHIYPSASSSSV